MSYSASRTLRVRAPTMLTLPPPIPIKSVWVGRMLSNRRHGGGASYRGSSNLLENHRWTNCHTHQSIQMRRRTGKPSSLTHVPRLMHLETSPMRHLRMEYGIPLIIKGETYDVNMTSPHAFVAVANHYFSSVSEKFSPARHPNFIPHIALRLRIGNTNR